jgi:hypothetical protein
MAATTTVSQFISADNFAHQPVARNSPFRAGVITLFGYGISVYVDRGHLIVADGIAKERRTWRFPRVGHGLKRLVTHYFENEVALHRSTRDYCGASLGTGTEAKADSLCRHRPRPVGDSV